MSPRRPPTAEPGPERLQEAAERFLARQSGVEEPEGSWVDRVWLPSDRERRSCCQGLEPDRLKDPQKLKIHCRTLLHVARLFDVDNRLLRAELKSRRRAAEAAAVVAAVGADRRRAKPARPAPREEAASAEATVLDARLVALIAEKRGDLRELLERAGRICDELGRQLADADQAVDAVLAETGAADVVADLKALIDDIHHLAITRDTIRRVG